MMTGMMNCVVLLASLAGMSMSFADDSAGMTDKQVKEAAELALEKQRIDIETGREALKGQKLDNALKRLPAADSLPSPQGVTVSKLSAEPRLLAQISLNHIAADLAKTLAAEMLAQKCGNPATVVIYDAASLNQISHHQLTKRQIDDLTRRYEEKANEARRALGEPPEGGAGHTPMFVDGMVAPTAIAFATLFRQDYEFQGIEFSGINELALVPQLASKLGSKVSVIYPAILIPGFADSKSSTSGSLDKLTDHERAANALIGELDAKDRAEKAEQAKKKNKKPAAAAPADDARREDTKPSKWATLAGELAALNKEREVLVKRLLAIDEKQSSLLLAAIRGEKLADAISEKNACILHLSVLAANGSTTIAKPTLGTPKISHSAGAIVSYLLFTSDGNLLKSATLHDYSGAKSIKTSDLDCIASNLENITDGSRPSCELPATPPRRAGRN